MRITELTVSFEKRVGDSNYGNENAHVELRALVETDDDVDTCIDILQAQARERVHADLGRSLNSSVRWAVEPRKVSHDDEIDDYVASKHELEPTPFDDIEVSSDEPLPAITPGGAP
jgi:hypothetical protein